MYNSFCLFNKWIRSKHQSKTDSIVTPKHAFIENKYELENNRKRRFLRVTIVYRFSSLTCSPLLRYNCSSPFYSLYSLFDIKLCSIKVILQNINLYLLRIFFFCNNSYTFFCLYIIYRKLSFGQFLPSSDIPIISVKSLIPDKPYIYHSFMSKAISG